MGFDRQSIGFAVMRIFIGLFFVGEGINKLPWFSDSSILPRIFSRWVATVPPGSFSRWYLDHIAIPGQSVLASLVPFGELCVGVALLVGLWTPVVAGLAFFMCLNYNTASGAIVRPDILTNGNVLPVLGMTLGLAIGGANLPWRIRISLRRRAATTISQ